MEYNHQKVRDLVTNAKPKKMTNKVLATEIGISLAALDKIKDGVNAPSIEALIKIAYYFKKDMNYFFDIEDEILLSIAAEPKAGYNEPGIDWKAQAEFYKKELDWTQNLITKFISGEIVLSDLSKGDSKMSG